MPRDRHADRAYHEQVHQIMRKAHRKTHGKGLPEWAWTTIAVVIGLAIGIGWSYYRPMGFAAPVDVARPLSPVDQRSHR